MDEQSQHPARRRRIIDLLRRSTPRRGDTPAACATQRGHDNLHISAGGDVNITLTGGCPLSAAELQRVRQYVSAKPR